MMMHSEPTDSFDELDEPTAPECAFLGCKLAGEYPASKSPENLRERIWLCLEHIREHNASWNYYAGMNVGEIESHWRSSATWERPTWPIGSRFNYSNMHDSIQDQIRQFTNDPACKNEPKPSQQVSSTQFPPGSKAAQAAMTLEIKGYVDHVTLRTAYKRMVKIHHPDANQGCKKSEEKLKEINEAYSELRIQLAKI